MSYTWTLDDRTFMVYNGSANDVSNGSNVWSDPSTYCAINYYLQQATIGTGSTVTRTITITPESSKISWLWYFKFYIESTSGYVEYSVICNFSDGTTGNFKSGTITEGNSVTILLAGAIHKKVSSIVITMKMYSKVVFLQETFDFSYRIYGISFYYAVPSPLHGINQSGVEENYLMYENGGSGSQDFINPTAYVKIRYNGEKAMVLTDSTDANAGSLRFRAESSTLAFAKA